MRLRQPENGILCFQAALARLNDDEKQPETAAPRQQKQSKQKQPKRIALAVFLTKINGPQVLAVQFLLRARLVVARERRRRAQFPWFVARLGQRICLWRLCLSGLCRVFLQLLGSRLYAMLCLRAQQQVRQRRQKKWLEPRVRELFS